MIRRYLLNIVRNNLIKQQRQSFSDPSKPKQTQTPLQQQKQQSQQEFHYEKQNRNTIGWTIWRILFWGSVGIFSYNYYLVVYPSSKPIEDQSGAIPGLIEVAKATYKTYNQIRQVQAQNIQFFSEPPLKKLLPDPIHPLMQPKTLVLNLSGTLLSTNFVMGKGMQLNRRPYLNQFLTKLSQLYQIVIFTNDDYIFLTNCIPKLDPRMQIISGYFGNECMVWYEGKYIKDLKYLNRDARNIIVIDSTLDNLKKHPKNAIILKDYKDEANDTQLLKLIPLLESKNILIIGMAGPQIKDVRKVLENLGQNPQDKFNEAIKAKQQSIKSKQSSKLFSLFSSKKQK